MTSVWPALWPPWKRTTMSACSDNQSTILPFPSSPHWAPTTTTLAISRVFPLKLSVFEHDRVEKPALPRVTSEGMLCRIMRPAKTQPGPLACEASHRIKDAGYRRKQERAFDTALEALQPIDIP